MELLEEYALDDDLDFLDGTNISEDTASAGPNNVSDVRACVRACVCGLGWPQPLLFWLYLCLLCRSSCAWDCFFLLLLLYGMAELGGRGGANHHFYKHITHPAGRRRHGQRGAGGQGPWRGRGEGRRQRRRGAAG
jgi:hypothetical protein